jgi:hydrogenase maturation protease
VSAPVRRVVVGVGNRFRSDDGAGLEVLDRLQAVAPGDVQLVESDGDPVSLLAAWEKAGVAVVVDAVRGGGKPGTIYRFNGHHRLPSKFFRRSTHLLGLADAVELARTLDKLPARLVIVGIEAKSVDHGETLTDPVMRALDRVTDLVVRLLEGEAADDGAVGAASA